LFQPSAALVNGEEVVNTTVQKAAMKEMNVHLMVAIVDVIRLRVIVLDVPRISMVISVRKNVALIVR
jgi:hypothetical protein